MNRRLPFAACRRRVGAALLLVCLIARAGVPAGFMPANGSWAFCQGLTAAATAEAGAAPDGPGAGKTRPFDCPFAAATVALADTVPTLPAVAWPAVRRLPGTRSRSVQPRHGIPPTALPRGPPVPT